MEIEIDKFYEERRHEREVSSPLTLRTLFTAFLLHLAAFVLFWIAAKIIYRAPDVIIPIDMTIVPPWAEQDPESRTTDVRDDLDEAVSRCNGELYDVFYSLGGIRTTLVEMEVRHG